MRKQKVKRQKVHTFRVMSSHCVPLPEAGAPDIIIFKGSSFVNAITCFTQQQKCVIEIRIQQKTARLRHP